MGIAFLNSNSVDKIMKDVREDLNGRVVDMDIEHYINSEKQDMFLAKIQYK